MVNFLAPFLKDLQKHLVPIYNLTKKNTTFKWTSECQKSFDTIKNMLTQPPILRMPDTKGIFRLMSDTSILATGAALYQFQDNNYYIVGYNSKKLPEAAKNYSITELELFGLVINIHASDNYYPMSTLNVFVTIQPSLTFSPAKRNSN